MVQSSQPSSDPVSTGDPPWRRSRTRQYLGLFAALFLFLAYFVHFWPDLHTANESARIYFVQALVDHHTPVLDAVLAQYRVFNIDIARFENHYYLDKAPGLSLLAAPLYWLLTRVFQMGISFAELPALCHLLLLGCVVLPATLGALAVTRLVEEETGDLQTGLIAGLITGAATPYALYATLFFGHGLAAACAIGSVFFSRKRYVLAGLLAGAMVLVDTATCMLASAIGLSLLWRTRSWRSLALFCLGGVPGVAAQFAYNALIFNGPLDFAYAHKASADLSSIHSQGLWGFTFPSMEALWGLTFGTERGLFFHAPILLLSLFCGRSTRPYLVISAAHFIFLAAFVDWRAGDTYTARHLIPIVPLLMVAVGDAICRHKRVRLVAPALGVYSAMVTWMMLSSFPYALAGLSAPVLEQAIPLLRAGATAPNVFGLTGPAALALPLLWLIAATVWAVPRQRMSWAGLGLMTVLLLAWPQVPTPTALQNQSFALAVSGYRAKAGPHCERFEGYQWRDKRLRCTPPQGEAKPSSPSGSQP